ncbi:MAG: hypothetical protein IJZ66_08835 [Oscillibacter sp.]|nr:hypothetical protein [Oscillibacter sp.]
MDKQEYIQQVLALMPDLLKREKKAVEEELAAHFEDRMEPLLALRGVDEAEAERRSIAAMGDPEAIGRELQKHYSYFWLWVDRILLALIVFVLLGSMCLAPVYLGHAWQNLVARVAPITQLERATRETWVDQELDLRTKVGSDILRFYAVGTTPEGTVRVFWCAYDERVRGRTSLWSFAYEDCRGQLLYGPFNGRVYANQGADFVMDEIEVPAGDPYITAVVERYGERITVDIPLTWEETP